ncbi:glycosyl hydrolase family 18 protein [Pontibacter sp. G13]|uniref:glycosyl hydrolase family 18 protein n=1 Tax=Pontibacter sp. G13 TaxID=3074898 RepID=UPI00288B683A|nr:glycosyl hydrolase family 18 protein [Pontibacter sp. G13]WNJ18381.1 glycosyl hydrolase family 18 protein [Pontibacter sp. G13]
MPTPTSNRVVVYLQDQSQNGLLPQCYQNLTAINLSSFHFGFDGPTPYIHLNNNVPSDPMFHTLWTNMASAQQNGVLLFAMLGGAGGAYTELFQNYSTFYPILKQMLITYRFDGVDLDIEEFVSPADLQMLISDLRRDFPSNFYITAAPVAMALKTGSDPLAGGLNWSHFKQNIDWFNVQFYSGYGSLSSTSDFNEIVAQGYPANQILGGALTNPSNGGGYVNISQVMYTLQALETQYGSIGGAMGWEFFNANNSGEQQDPVGWAQDMATAVRKNPSSSPA